MLALAVAGCAAPALRYAPERQPSGTPISADYDIVGERLRVEIDTGGYRVEAAEIVRADGALVRASSIDDAPRRGGTGIGFGLGFGIGGASFRGGVGVGAGAGAGSAVGRAEANTFADFPLAEIGPAPWRLRVKVVGTQVVEIVLEPARPAAR